MTIRDNCGKRIRFICHRNGRCKSEKRSGKTDCKRAVTVGQIDGTWRVTNNIEGHDHDLLPVRTDTLTEGIQKDVRALYHSGSTPTGVAMFIKERHGLELSALDIDQVVKADFPDFTETESETDGLIRAVHEAGGRSAVFSIDTQQGPKKAAVMVVMPEHEQEWKRFGEAVWIDSTAINNHLRWNLIPFTLCNGAKGLAYGGWFVTAGRRRCTAGGYLST